MPDLEILRRCRVCGAASRPGASLCPNCGNAIAGADPDFEVGSAEKNQEQALDAKVRRPGESAPKLPAPNPAPADRSIVAVRPDGERARKVSTGLSEGVVYDPSFRFVIVAAVVLLFFLVILWLSKVIT